MRGKGKNQTILVRVENKASFQDLNK